MFKKLRNKLLIINTLIIAALVLSSFSVIYIMTAQNVNKNISQKLDRAIEFIRPDHNPRQKDNMQKPIDDVPPDQNGNVPPNPNTVDPNADNINKSRNFRLLSLSQPIRTAILKKSTHRLI